MITMLVLVVGGGGGGGEGGGDENRSTYVYAIYQLILSSSV